MNFHYSMIEAGEAPVAEAPPVDYYAGAKRVTVGGVPQRVFQWRTKELAAQIAAIETARDAGCELDLADAPLFSFVPVERSAEHMVKRRGAAPVPKPSPMMKEYYKGGVRIVIGGVPCRMPRPFGKNHSPRHWASLNEPMQDWELRARQWWKGVIEARGESAEADPIPVQSDPIPVFDPEPEPIPSNVVESTGQPIEPETAADAVSAYLVRTISAESGRIDQPFATLAAAVAEVATMYLRREWASIHSAGIAEGFSIHPHGGRWAVKDGEKPLRWAMSFEADDGYKSAACHIAERCGVRYASHRRGYQASNRAIGRFALEWDARVLCDAPAPEPVQREDEPAPPVTLPDAPAIASSEAVADENGQAEPDPDPIAVILARLETLEAAIATLPVEREAAPIASVRPKRTVAHERAVRRYLAMRTQRDRRALETDAALAYARRCEAERKEWLEVAQRAGIADRASARIAGEALAEIERLKAKRRRAVLLARNLQNRLNAEYRMVDQANERRHEAEAKAGRQRERRQRGLERGRRMVMIERERTAGARDRAVIVEAELAQLRCDMADPLQPERASDIAMLLQERDTERAANAALLARCERAEASRDELAGHVEAMGTRLANAEAVVRRMAAA